MLLLLPPSEGKRTPGRSRPMDLDALTLPELAPVRQELLAELGEVSARPDAAALLGVPDGAAGELAANVRWQTSGALRAAELYDGVLFDALDLPTLDAAARRRAQRDVVIFSAAHGVLRLGDRVAPYRLSAGASLPQAGSVVARWRQALSPAFDAVVGDQVVVDVRSGGYRPMWRPGPERRDRWVKVEVPGASHHAKHTRGLVVRELLLAGGRVSRPEQLLAPLHRFASELEPATGGGLQLVVRPPSA